MIPLLFPFLAGYAETHYRLSFLKPFYYRKQPEIISDVPIRVIRDRTAILPVLLILKDAHIFPVTLKSVLVDIMGKDRRRTFDFQIDEQIETPYYSKLLYPELSCFDPDQNLRILVRMIISDGKSEFQVINDNFRGIEKLPYRTFYSQEPLPYPDGWFAGEPHYHSNFTSDQVEFGADLRSTGIMARAMGLDWMFVTDHSYDLDDMDDDYTREDPELGKWSRMRSESKTNDDQLFRIIPGEEVSIGNSRDRNVHLLVINRPGFIPGRGDSAEIWFQNHPTLNLKDIRDEMNRDELLFIAAHPFDKLPLLQKITLRRGYWSALDYSENKISHLQVINNSNHRKQVQAVSSWKQLLLSGHRLFMIAGNDAHGNFNLMRQIRIPFLKLFSSREQCFGRYHTVFQAEKNDPVRGLKRGRILAGNGPFLDFSLEKGNNRYHPGETVEPGTYRLEIDRRSSTEFGPVRQTRIYLGNYQTGKEQLLRDYTSSRSLDLISEGYIRLEMTTEKGGRTWSNPIWISSEAAKT